MSAQTPFTLLQVAGGTHGPEEYARSPVHHNVADYLLDEGAGIQTIFVPSAHVAPDIRSGELVGRQMAPSWQLGLLCNAINRVKQDSRVPVALSHSSGCLATMAAIHSGELPFATIASPTFIDPRLEIFHSKASKRKLELTRNGGPSLVPMIQPNGFNYQTFYDKNYFDDELFQTTYVSSSTVGIDLAFTTCVYFAQKSWRPKSILLITTILRQLKF